MKREKLKNEPKSITTNKNHSAVKKANSKPLISPQIIIKPNQINHNNNDPFEKRNNSKDGNGRSLKLTLEMQEMIIEAVKIGNMPISQVCQLAGINAVSFYNWLKWGKAEASQVEELLEEEYHKAVEERVINPNNSEKVDEFMNKIFKKLKPTRFFYFFKEIKKAEAEAEQANLAAIRQAGESGNYVTEMTQIIDVKTKKVTGLKSVKRSLQPQWQSRAWLLERKYPDRYGERNRLDIEGSMRHDGEIEHRHTLELPDGDERVAGVLGILLASGAFQQRLITGCSGESSDQAIVEAEAQ